MGKPVAIELLFYPRGGRSRRWRGVDGLEPPTAPTCRRHSAARAEAL